MTDYWVQIREDGAIKDCYTFTKEGTPPSAVPALEFITTVGKSLATRDQNILWIVTLNKASKADAQTSALSLWVILRGEMKRKNLTWGEFDPLEIMEAIE